MTKIPFDGQDLANRFGYHTPTNKGIADDHQDIRAATMALAEHMVAIVPTSRELAIAIERLEEAMYWANAGIARIKNYLGERPSGELPE